MSVVINEFEVVPAAPERPQASQPATPEPLPPAAVAQLEVERAVAARRERESRLKAD